MKTKTVPKRPGAGAIIWNEATRQVKNLIRLVGDNFLGPEERIAIEYLMRQPNSEMNQEILRQQLRFDVKTMKITTENLLAQRFIKMRRSDNTNRKVDTLRMDYKTALGVILRKIDMCQQAIEKFEIGCHPTEYMNFKCSGCSKSYHIFQIKDIFSKPREELRCSFCDQLVEEDIREVNLQVTMGNFNKQLEPIFALVKGLSGTQTQQFSETRQDHSVNNSNRKGSQGHGQAGNPEPNYKVTVNIIDSEEMEEEALPPSKEMPPWLTQPAAFHSPYGPKSWP